MSEQVWYVYQESQQLGPFAHQQLVQLFSTNMVAQDAYIFKVGWKDWRPVEECQNDLGISLDQVVSESDVHSQTSAPVELSSERRSRAPRATIKGRVIVHNNGQLVIGAGVNISASGIFVETSDLIFNIGETLKLTCRIDGRINAFNVSAVVMRFNDDSRFPVGYGLRFSDLEPHIANEIQQMIDQENQSLGVLDA